MTFFSDPANNPRNPFDQGPTLFHSAFRPSAASPPTEEADVDPEEKELEGLYSELKSLTLHAETVVAEQLRATQLKLLSETRSLFNDYKHFGSMTRLEKDLEKYFKAGTRDGSLYFKSRAKATGQAIFTPIEEETAHYGNAFMVNHTADDDRYDHPLISRTAENVASADPHPLRIIDTQSIPYVATLPWDPVGMELTWPKDMVLPEGLLVQIDQILNVVDYECRVRLFHHVCKYGPSPVIRAGIAAQVQSHYSTIFQSRSQHNLGLTPETRVFLRSVFDKAPSINTPEGRMLSRVCRVDDDTIDMFWEDLSAERKPHTAMRIFITAREIEKGRRLVVRDKREFLRLQREKIFREKTILEQQETEQSAKEGNATHALNTRKAMSASMSAGLPRSEAQRFDRDLEHSTGEPTSQRDT